MPDEFILEEQIKNMGDRALLEMMARKVFQLPCQDKNFCPATVAAPLNWRKWAIGCVCIGLGIGASLSVGWQGVATLIKIVVKS